MKARAKIALGVLIAVLFAVAVGNHADAMSGWSVRTPAVTSYFYADSVTIVGATTRVIYFPKKSLGAVDAWPSDASDGQSVTHLQAFVSTNALRITAYSRSFPGGSILLQGLSAELYTVFGVRDGIDSVAVENTTGGTSTCTLWGMR